MAGEWEEVPLDELVDDIVDRRGVTPLKLGSDFVAKGFRVISAKAIKGRRVDLSADEPRFVDEATYRKWMRVPLRADDVILTSEAPLGEPAYLSEDAEWCLGQRLFAIRTRKTHMHGRFLFYALQSERVRHDLLSRATGTTAQGIRQTELRLVQIPRPGLDGQRAIAHILGTLDDKIELNRRMSEALEAMARALFKSWFVDFDPVRAKAEGRDPGLPTPLADLFPASLADSTLGAIPEGWEVGVLKNALAELEVGGRPKGGVATYTHGVPSVGAESIVGLGVFDYSKTKYIPREYFDQMTKGHIKSRDVLLYKDGGRPGEFEPHVALFGDGFPFETAAINEHVYRLRATSRLGQEFLFFWLSSGPVMEEMRVKGTGVAVPGLNSTQVRSLTTLFPSKDVIKAFAQCAGAYITRILAACNESRTLADLRDTLLPKLISGELRIRDAEKFVGRVA